MNALIRFNGFLARWLAWFAAPVALAARWYVGWQFMKSGLLKWQTWDSTLWLFANEYHVPLLSPHVAAYAGTFGELFFPSLLFLGLFSRIGALGLSFVNVVAVVSYSHVLLADGMQAALGQHILWGSILLYLVVHGPGAFSLDRWLSRRPAPSVAY